jgi:hypothetical protein
MVLNLLTALVVSRRTPPPSDAIRAMVEEIRVPRGSKVASSAH